MLSKPLSAINNAENLQFLAGLIQDHDHLASILQSEPNPRSRRQKFDVLKAYLPFETNAYSWYMLSPQDRGHIWIPHYV